MSNEWWRNAVIYQIYPRSFADSNGDGIGDLEGVRQRLQYVKDLGVDAIWFNPFYVSPQADAGYDVADFRDVDALFGSLADFDELEREIHALGLKVIVDIVPNHTSDRHPWFKAALASSPGSKERDRYMFRPGKGADHSAPPNDWMSVFGGGAWKRTTNEDGTPGDDWFLHLFAPEQPDLNWRNPEVRAEFEDILRFWFERDVDGFRIDVAHGLIKEEGLPDLDGRFVRTPLMAGRRTTGHPHWDQEEVHEIYRDWRRVADEFDGDKTFVAEAWLDSPSRLAMYLRKDELHTAFNFAFLTAVWEPMHMKATIDSTIAALADVGAPTTWVLSNHDVQRHVTRYAQDGDLELGRQRARAAALLMFALPGGAYVYQGEELGLEEILDIPAELRQDPTFLRTEGVDKGRDGCRVPLPWSGDEAPFGFSTTKSWLPQPSHWKNLTVESQDGDRDSMLALYRNALRIRRELVSIEDTEVTWLASPEGTLAFRRARGLTCVVNFTNEAVVIDESITASASIVLSTSSDAVSNELPANGAVWYFRAHSQPSH